MTVSFHLKPMLRFPKPSHKPHNFSLLLHSQVISKHFRMHWSIMVLILPPQNWGTQWGSELLKVIHETTAEPGAEDRLPRSTHSNNYGQGKKCNALSKYLPFLNKD